MKTLYYFTNAFPFGLGEDWKKNELSVLSGYFDRIEVVPLVYDGNRNAVELPSNASFHLPLIGESLGRNRIIAELVTTPIALVPVILAEYFHSGAFKSYARLRTWLGASAMLCALYRHNVFRKLRKLRDGSTYLYFFWGTGLSYAVSFLHGERFGSVAVRYHRVDLYEDLSPGGYIPYRRKQLQNVSLALTVSDQGRNYLKGRYGDLLFACETFRLGCISRGISRVSTDGILRIVSCSALTAVKRIDLIIDALRIVPRRVIWKHLGGGELADVLMQKTLSLPKHIECIFTGRLRPQEVLDHYVGKEVDLFINVSASEGVPVSVMEALSAGIPVLATDVGGTAEIVDDSVGKLLSAGVTAGELALELEAFATHSEQSKAALRNSAFRRYAERCNAEEWATRLAERITNNSRTEH